MFSVVRFQVDYLGSVSLSNRSSDLFSLQKPLKSLYFKYLDTKLTGSAEDEALPGNLEITKTGLKVSDFYMPRPHAAQDIMLFVEVLYS